MASGAPPSLFASQRDPLARYVVISLVGHALLLGLGIFVSALTGPRLIDLDQKPIKASLVRKGKPRDEKLLPRKEELPPPPKAVEAAPPPPVPTPAPAPAAVPVPGVAPTPKTQQKQEGEKTGEQRRKQLFGAFDRLGKAAKPEELEGAADGDEQGDSAVQEGERYFGLIKAQVRRHYDVSSSIPEQERLHLRAQVVVTIGKSGEVLSANLAKSSGNPLFDSAVLTAVKRASPFSPPPEHLREQLRRDGIVFPFTP